MDAWRSRKGCQRGRPRRAISLGIVRNEKLIRAHKSRTSLPAAIAKASFAALGFLNGDGFVRLLFKKALGVRMQLREYGLKLIDVDVQDPLEELAANFLEPQLQVRYNTPPLAGRLDDQEPMIARVAPARKKPARFEPVREPRDLAFVSAHSPRELSRGGCSFLHAMQKHCRFLRRHPELAETAIERCLQSNAGAEEPGNREFRLPLSDPGIVPLRLLRPSSRIP